MIAALFFLFGSINVLAENPPSTNQVIRIDGSGAISGFVKSAVLPFARSRKIGVTVDSHGATVGVSCLLEKTCHIGMTSVISPSDASKLIITPLGYDAHAIFVSNDVPVKNITSDQVRAIFQKKIQNWKELGGPDLPIHVINRSKKIGVRKMFEDRLNLKSVAPDLDEAGTHSELTFRAKGLNGVITYDAMGVYLAEKESNLHALSLDGIEPSNENVLSGKYKFINYFSLSRTKENKDDKNLQDLIEVIRAARKDYFPKYGMLISD